MRLEREPPRQRTQIPTRRGGSGCEGCRIGKGSKGAWCRGHVDRQEWLLACLGIVVFLIIGLLLLLLGSRVVVVVRGPLRRRQRWRRGGDGRRKWRIS
ncbi:hypothetical protein KSS87_019245 [Heliosperma pusillum]|nr:hypothetical protein KSS87_019245 [Heliosperma pusillum]